MWDLIVSVPDHCLSFYFSRQDHPAGCADEPRFSCSQQVLVRYGINTREDPNKISLNQKDRII